MELSSGGAQLLAECARLQAAAHWRLMGSRDVAEAEGVFRQHITRRWSATVWRSWSDSIRQRVRVVNQRTDVLLRAQGRAPAGAAAEIEMDAPGVPLRAHERRARGAPGEG